MIAFSDGHKAFRASHLIKGHAKINIIEGIMSDYS